MSLAHALEMATASDPGMVRSHNEDSILADAMQGVAVLADGMGGYNAGEVASGMATSLMASELNGLAPDLARHAGDPDRGRARVESLLRDRIERVNKAIFEASQTETQYAGMGTTLCGTVSSGSTRRSSRPRRPRRSTPAWGRRWSWRSSTTTA